MAQIKFIKDVQISERFSKDEVNRIAYSLVTYEDPTHTFKYCGEFFKEDWSGFLSLSHTTDQNGKVTITLAIDNDVLSDYIDYVQDYANNSVATEYMRYMYKHHFFAFLHIFKHHKTNIDEFNEFFTKMAKEVINLDEFNMETQSNIGKEIHKTLDLTSVVMGYDFGMMFTDAIESRIEMAGKENTKYWINAQKK